MDIKFLKTHMAQTECMLRFKSKSSINKDCCIGAIDSMFIWFIKPNKCDQKVFGFGPAKFFCGQKKKYGLKMMGVCDSRRRFIWVEKKPETAGFLRPGFCLFGDNAYINSRYMCMPWRKITPSHKDAMKFSHSQLRIIIECAFHILVHRWGMLRKPIPVNMSVAPNFCIVQSCDDLDNPSVQDIANIAMNGELAMRTGLMIGDLDRLNELVDGGCHMDDHTHGQRRQYHYETDFPCHEILNYVKTMDYQRPDISRQRMQHDHDTIN
ncbi:LOW QUALITY PROTEIN: hypothetical protein ACHAW6_002101 [Cyclotella cf. meneghiniana]